MLSYGINLFINLRSISKKEKQCEQSKPYLYTPMSNIKPVLIGGAIQLPFLAVLFGIFDIWKPWPINVIDKSLGGGLGIMLDDVLAAIYASVVIHCLGYFGLFQIIM